MVPRTQRAELLGRLGGPVGGQFGRRLVGGQPAVGVAGHSVVALADAGGNRLFDATEERLERVGQRVLGDVELGGDHPAADVDAHGRGDHRVLGRDDRADGGAQADVGVGHEGDVAHDDGETSSHLGLTDGSGIDLARPGDQLGVDGGGHVAPPTLTRDGGGWELVEREDTHRQCHVNGF